MSEREACLNVGFSVHSWVEQDIEQEGARWTCGIYGAYAYIYLSSPAIRRYILYTLLRLKL